MRGALARQTSIGERGVFMNTAKKIQTTQPLRIFVTGSPEEKAQRDFFIRQLKMRKTDVCIEYSSPGQPFEKPWLIRTKEYIRRSNIFVCLIGSETWLHSPVQWELTVAIAMKKKIVALQLDSSKLIVPPFPLIDNSIPVKSYNLDHVIESLFPNSELHS